METANEMPLPDLRRSITLAAAVMLVCACGAFASDESGRDEMLAGADAAVQKVELGFENKLSESTAKLTKGGVLELDLKSNPTTGYKWFLSGIDGESVKSQGNKFGAPDTKMIGAGGIDVWKFLAHAEGTSKITLDYKRPWEDTPVSQAVVTVNVE